jgi:hypothetical protein
MTPPNLDIEPSQLLRQEAIVLGGELGGQLEGRNDGSKLLALTTKSDRSRKNSNVHKPRHFTCHFVVLVGYIAYYFVYHLVAARSYFLLQFHMTSCVIFLLRSIILCVSRRGVDTKASGNFTTNVFISVW